MPAEQTNGVITNSCDSSGNGVANGTHHGVVVNGVETDATPNVPNVVQNSALGLRCQVSGTSVDMPTVTGPLSIDAVCKAAARSTSSGDLGLHNFISDEYRFT